MTAQPILPTFLVIGAAKAGTTSLWRYLKGHPDVFMCSPKEPEFFLGGHRWRRGLEWYGSLFARGEKAKARGEASVTYTYFPLHQWVPNRIHRTIPDVRLVYVIRNPVDRIVSMYRFRVNLGLETRPIDEAVLDRVYLEPSRYAQQIDRYMELFDRSQLLVITSEDLAERRLSTVRSVYEFIGVDPDVEPATVEREFNRSVDHRRKNRLVPRLRDTKFHWMVRRVLPSDSRLNQLVWRMMSRRTTTPEEAVRLSDELVSQIRIALGPDIERLPEYLGGDFHCWGMAPPRPGRR